MSCSNPNAVCPATKLKRANRELKKALKELCFVNRQVIAALDREMKLPSDHARGQRVGKIVQVLETQNDMARHFALDEKFPLKRP